MLLFTQMRNCPIGIFDSGVGGLSVLREVRRQLPGEAIIYFGDQIHIPYGIRPVEEILRFSYAITNLLISVGAKLIVVACNTASAVALQNLRLKFPQIPFVGMEPAIKPAAETTHTKVVGVLATPATFQGELYASVVERFADNVTLLQNTCPGLVQEIERGNLHSNSTRKILESALHPMLEKRIDTIVLGCTHYPFVIPLIQEIVGPDVRVIDPAPAVARQVRRVLESQNLQKLDSASPLPRLFTSGNLDQFKTLLPKLIEQECIIQKGEWVGEEAIVLESS
jgi:glutamate racemase